MKNARLLTALLATSLTSGCVIYTDDDDNDYTPPPQQDVNYAPLIGFAEAGCYWDNYNGDFIWYFDSHVFDDDGWRDIRSVHADVYDAYGDWVDSFELYRETPDPDVWFSDWLQYSTYLDCYYGGYTVDFVAYDQYEAYDIVSTQPYTY